MNILNCSHCLNSKTVINTVPCAVLDFTTTTITIYSRFDSNYRKMEGDWYIMGWC